MKEQIKTLEKELCDEEISNLSDAKFKTLVVGMLTEMVEYGPKMEEKLKAILSEIKENVQGTNSEGKETGTQINGLEHKEEINIQPEQMKKQEFQKNEERLRNVWDNFKCSNNRIREVPEGEEKEQEIENLFENIRRTSPIWQRK